MNVLLMTHQTGRDHLHLNWSLSSCNGTQDPSLSLESIYWIKRDSDPIKKYYCTVALNTKYIVLSLGGGDILKKLICLENQFK